ncbi:cysteine desulfurase family protein [Kytococcus sp. Marseille-QA3725]
MDEVVYLDHAASSPQRPEVTEAMASVAGLPGNPSALHAVGREARRRVEEAREEVAALIGAHPSEVIFTSGGTEADNLAVLGGHEAVGRPGAPVVTTRTEHAAVTEAVARLNRIAGVPVSWAEVDGDGVLTASALAAALDGPGTEGEDGDGVGGRAGHGAEGDEVGPAALASIVWGNNETGVLQDLPALAQVARERGCSVHADAVQVLGHTELDVAGCGADLLSLAGHKVGGPQGIGALVARRGVGLEPATFGGGQERRVRSGTVPVAQVVGFAAAVRCAVEGRRAGVPGVRGGEAARIRALREEFEAGVLDLGVGARVTGSGAHRLDHIAHVTFDGCRSEDLLFLLDAAGVAVSAGSACSAGVNRPSHVLEAMGRSAEEAGSGLRFSWGWSSTAADGERALQVLPEVVERARAAARV